MWQFKLAHQRGAAIQACTPERCSNSSLLTRTSSSSSLLIRLSSSSSLLIRLSSSSSLLLRQRKLSTSGDGGSCQPHKASGGRQAAAAKAVDCKKLSSFELKLSWRGLLGESARGKIEWSGSECTRTRRAGWRHRQQCRAGLIFQLGTGRTLAPICQANPQPE